MKQRTFLSRPTLLIGAGFLAIAFVVYGASLRNGFVLWDDNYLITQNPAIRGVTPWTLKESFTTFDPELYIPVTLISYQLNYLVAKLDPWMYHLSNLLLHTLNAFLLTLILGRLLRRTEETRAESPLLRNIEGSIAVFCGILFLIHPLNTEAVAWASARKDVLAVAFSLVAILSYLRWREDGERKWYLLSIALLLLGLLSKVLAIVVPVLMLLIDWYQRRPFSRHMLLEKVPHFSLAVLLGIVGMFGKRETQVILTLVQKVLLMARSLMDTLWRFFFPADLSPLYHAKMPISIAEPTYAIPVVLCLLMALIVLLTLRRSRAIAFGAACALLAFLPAFITFEKNTEIFVTSDRYAYLPQLGLFFLVGLAAQWVIQRASMARRILTALVGVAAVLLGALALQQSLLWKDSVTLISHALTLEPQSLPARNNLGVALLSAGREAEARKVFQEILTIRPYDNAFKNLALIETRHGNLDEALRLYGEADTIAPGDPEIPFSQALLFMEKGDAAMAKEKFQETVRRNPDHLGARNNLGILAMREGKLGEARGIFQWIIDRNPLFPDAHVNLGNLAKHEGKIDEALAEYRRTLEVQPTALDAIVGILPILLKRGETEEALDLLAEAVEFDPSNEEIREIAEVTAGAVLKQEPGNRKAKILLESVQSSR